jgi:hypothetical protein
MRSRQGDKGCDPCQRAIITNLDIQRRKNTRLIMSRRYIQSINYTVESYINSLFY